jgi:hypothetical protein
VHETFGCIEYPDDLFVPDAGEAEGAQEGSAHDIVAMNLGPGNLLPCSRRAVLGTRFGVYPSGLVQATTAKVRDFRLYVRKHAVTWLTSGTLPEGSMKALEPVHCVQ